MDTPVGQSTVGELLPFLIIIGFLLLFAIFCFRMAIKTSKIKKEAKQKRAALISKGFIRETYGRHISGLPIAEGIYCTISQYKDYLEFTNETLTVTLTLDKIKDIALKTDVEIQQQYVSSVGGAVAGGLAFGPIGAIIGGRAKKKKDKTVSHYLIITYQKDNDLQFIGFDIIAYTAASKIVSDLRPKLDKTSIEL